MSYNITVDNVLKNKAGLSARMHLNRVQWMRMALLRSNRVVDTNVIGHLQQNISFFASTSILVIAGLLALLGASGTAMGIVKQIPFTTTPTKLIWYLKILLFIGLFIYAFFKYTYALRMLNYCAVMIGCMPENATEEDLPIARRAAILCTMAVKEMNRGLRSYYFSIAALGSFINPWIFIIASGWVVVVLYRREFKSHILQILNMPSRDLPLSRS